jgi:CHAT domain-containing protein/tetratricopeptide (TPR) repeat protein
MFDKLRMWRWRRVASVALLAVVLLSSAAARAQNVGQGISPEQSKALDEILVLMRESRELRDAGKTDAAIEVLKRALAKGEKAFGDGHLSVALTLDMLGLLYFQKNDFANAESSYLRARAIREKLEGYDHADVASTLTGLGSVYARSEKFANAEAAYERALAIREKAFGADSPEVASTLYSLSSTFTEREQYERAEPLLKRALAIQEKALGADSLEAALTLNNLAYLYLEKGDYNQSEALYKRSLATFEKLFGPDGRLVATPLNSLATLYREKGDYLRAEPMLKRALEIQEKTAGAEHPDTAVALNSLALLYSEKGDDERALPLFERALAIREKAEGAESSTVAATLDSIAEIYNQRGQRARAISLYQRALAILEKTIGIESPLYATVLGNLGIVYADEADYAQSEQLFRRALAIDEKVLGANHPDVAITLSNLAYLSFVKKDYATEESLYRRALAIAERAYGADHPSVGTYLANLATVYWGRGDTADALDLLTRNAELRERNLALLLTVGSEEQKRRYMATLANETDGLISFHLRAAPNDARAAELALTTVLRRKGRVLDAMADQYGALRRHLTPQDAALLNRLAEKRAELARLVLKGGDANAPAERAEKSALLQTEIERLEQEVSARSAQFRTQSLPVTLAAVRDALPAGAALVEFISYRPYDPNATGASRFGASRYAVYVVRREGGLRWADLGESSAIDRRVAAWRRSLMTLAADVKQGGRALDELLMRPVRALTGDARQLFLSPDGSLNLIPFAALVDEDGKYLVESYSISYLTSGRDLLRLQVSAAPRGGALVLANPAFDNAAAAATVAPTTTTQAGARPTAAQSRRSIDLASSRFTPLPGTAAEAQALGAILPGAQVLTGAEATEAALKRVSAPSVLHVATHGFFLPDQKQSAEDATRGLSLGGAQGAMRGENPLLRSGLALAGANQQRDGAGEDGILTAYEAAGLDLWGTRLVVLSACETGIGEVTNGEGVYGLRRALVLAGSESQVMSLWQVSDEATRDLMIAYYRRLQAGAGRSEGLREVQLGMLRGQRQSSDSGQRGIGSELGAGKGRDRSHPFYWAAFIQSGEWKPMTTIPGARD